MLPAMRSGRSVKKSVTGLTPVRVSRLAALSKLIPFAVWTKRKSAWVSSARTEPAGAAASTVAPTRKARRDAHGTVGSEGRFIAVSKLPGGAAIRVNACSKAPIDARKGARRRARLVTPTRSGQSEPKPSDQLLACPVKIGTVAPDVFACFRRKLVSQIGGRDEVLHRMANSIPLIRSAALFPMIRWLRAEWSPCTGAASCDRPRIRLRGCAGAFRFPLLAVLEFFRSMGALEGPDIGARVVTTDSLADLGTFGLAILGGSTPRTALQCAVSVLPRYSTHELVTLRRMPGGLCVQAGWSLAIDDETMHVTQQFTAMLVQALCAATGVTHGEPSQRSHPASPQVWARPSAPLLWTGSRRREGSDARHRPERRRAGRAIAPRVHPDRGPSASGLGGAEGRLLVTAIPRVSS